MRETLPCAKYTVIVQTWNADMKIADINNSYKYIPRKIIYCLNSRTITLFNRTIYTHINIILACETVAKRQGRWCIVKSVSKPLAASTSVHLIQLSVVSQFVVTEGWIIYGTKVQHYTLPAVSKPQSVWLMLCLFHSSVDGEYSTSYNFSPLMFQPIGFIFHLQYYSRCWQWTNWSDE